MNFAVGGMTCASCVQFVEKELTRIPGVEYVSVNLASGKAYMVTDGRPDWEDFAAAVNKAGYTPLKEIPSEDENEIMFKAARSRVFIAWAFAIPAVVLMVLHMSGIHLPWLPFAEALAGIAVLLGPGRQILKGAWIAVTHRHANMDVLVSLGTLAAWTTAVLAIADFPVWSFGAMAPMLPAFHLTGRLLEEYLRRQAGADLRALTSSGGGTVTVIDQGSIRELPVETVKVGMTTRIRTGERIPLDGRITVGSAAVGEAMITGEPLPAVKDTGDEVIGGTVVESGYLEVEVTKTGEDAFLARMLSLVEQAQGIQIPLQALADRVSGIFVPAVFSLAILTFGAWVLLYESLLPLLNRAAEVLPWIPMDAGPWTTALFAMVSMLVVACPCALGLATPMAVSVGSGLAARRGLLIKGSEALQTSGELDVLVFDKTGTLTVGRPTVTASDLSARDRRNAAALEAYSVHPLAHAIVRWEKTFGETAEHPPAVEQVREVAGEGISGLVDGVPYSVGRSRNQTDTARQGTAVEVLRNGQLAGRIILNDAVKEEAAGAVTALIKRGIKPIMATGDEPAAALAVAAKVGIPSENVQAQLKPEDKLRIVQDYQKQNLRVGMIGDGINDAAALKAADVGFALAQGTDLSIEAGDVVITRGGLERIEEALSLSGLMVKKIKGNLIWAFSYNLLAIPAAALAFIHPLMAEATMSLSSLGVILNSLRIRRTKI